MSLITLLLAQHAQTSVTFENLKLKGDANGLSHQEGEVKSWSGSKNLAKKQNAKEEEKDCYKDKKDQHQEDLKKQKKEANSQVKELTPLQKLKLMY